MAEDVFRALYNCKPLMDKIGDEVLGQIIDIQWKQKYSSFNLFVYVTLVLNIFCTVYSDSHSFVTGVYAEGNGI